MNLSVPAGNMYLWQNLDFNWIATNRICISGLFKCWIYFSAWISPFLLCINKQIHGIPMATISFSINGTSVATDVVRIEPRLVRLPPRKSTIVFWTALDWLSLMGESGWEEGISFKFSWTLWLAICHDGYLREDIHECEQAEIRGQVMKYKKQNCEWSDINNEKHILHDWHLESQSKGLTVSMNLATFHAELV